MRQSGCRYREKFCPGSCWKEGEVWEFSGFKESDGLRSPKLNVLEEVERERNRWRRWRGQWIECHDGDKTEVPEDC